MDLADVRELYRYHDWANEQVFTAVRALPAEALTRELGGSFKSIRDLLAHVAGGEWAWLERWHGRATTQVPAWYETDDVAELLARLAQLRAERDTYLESLDEQALHGVLSFRYISGRPGAHPLGDTLFHIVNHGTYHRGQLVTMLRQVGAVPPSTDYTVFKAQAA